MGFTILSGLNMINARIGILMTGAMAGPEAAGLFTVAVRGGELLLIAFIAVNLALEPRIAELAERKNWNRLQFILTRAYRGVALMTLPVLLLFVFFRQLPLALFGERYMAAGAALVIISVAQYVNILLGPVATLMNMTGHERVTMVGGFFSIVVNVGLNLVLIPALGVTGAAVSTLAGVLTWNILLAVMCWRRLGIWAPAVGLKKWRQNPGPASSVN